MPFIIRKSFTFEAAHQLELAHTKACSDCIHGHSYTVEMFLESDLCDDMEMVVDFGVLKPFKKQVMEEWDHGLLLHVNKQKWFKEMIKVGILKKEKVHFFQAQPTAEFMAWMLFVKLEGFLKEAGHNVAVNKVRVHETSNGYAEYTGGMA